MAIKSFMVVLLVATVASCTPEDSSPSHSSESTVYSGNLYYESYFDLAFVSYNFQARDESSIHTSKGIDRISISPDGSRFSLVNPGESELTIIDLRDDSNSFILDGSVFNFKGEIEFSPNSEYIIQEEENFADSRLRIRKGKNLVSEISADEVRPFTGKWFDNWTWINNQSAVFASGTHIYVIDDINSGEIKLLKDLSPYYVGYLDVSNDEERIAYTKTLKSNSAEEGDIYHMKINGTDERQLTKNSILRSLAWSPNDKYIAFVAGEWVGGADMGFDLCPSIHIIPSDLDEPVYVEYGEAPQSEEVHTVKFNYKDGTLKDSCNNSQFLYWNP